MSYQVMMSIFDHQRSFDTFGYPRVVPSDGGDVDEQPRFRVDPPRINDIEPIFFCPFHITRVDFEQVVSRFRYIRQLVMIHGHVVVARKEVHRPLGDLSIDVRVPGEDLGTFSSLRRAPVTKGDRLTLPFHHHPSRVPCMIQVSAPMSAIVER